MRYSLDQLAVFVLATQAGSFSAAARRGKTQSTISNTISNLEADLGVQLFDRSSKLALTLLPQGMRFWLKRKKSLSAAKVLKKGRPEA